MKVYSFPRGGFTFEDPTAPKKDKAINAFLPAISVIPLGSPGQRIHTLVSQGDTVKEGMLIGRASGAGAVNIHATVPGKILRKITWQDGDDQKNSAFVIKMDGAFEKLGRKEEFFPMTGLNGYDLQKIISEYGIIEMENSGRPLAEMISASRKGNNNLTLVIRCVFDDPWLVADYALCMDRMKEVIQGACIVAKACKNVSQVIFAVSYKEKDLSDKFIENAGLLDLPYSLVKTGSRYPQRNDRELELALRLYEKSEGTDFGCFLILGPSVLAAVHDAVLYKKPVLDRYVAIGGSAVRNPQIMKVRIGTRIGELIEQCGGFCDRPHRIIAGSVLSGREVMYLDEPVDKQCYAIVAMTKSHSGTQTPQNCINCGECRVVCPVGLDPQYIYKQINVPADDSIKVSGCHNCGCCKMICPSALPLSETIMRINRETENA